MQRIPSLASIASIVASIVSVAPVAPAILIALTALGHAGHASAQSTVTLYGLIDSGISYVDNGAAGATVRQQSGVSQGSRWGFLGSEDLGGGNKANIVLEGGFFNDTGVMTGNGGFSRRSIVGLFGAWARRRRAAKSRRNSARQRLTVLAPWCGPSLNCGAGSSVHQLG